MGEVLEPTWLMVSSFLNGNGGYAVFISLPFVFGALGYSFCLTTFVAAILYVFITTDGREVRDLNEEMAWVFGSLGVHLLVFWFFHKAAQFLFRPVFPIHRWIIDRWASHK